MSDRCMKEWHQDHRNLRVKSRILWLLESYPLAPNIKDSWRWSLISAISHLIVSQSQWVCTYFLLFPDFFLMSKASAHHLFLLLLFLTPASIFCSLSSCSCLCSHCISLPNFQRNWGSEKKSHEDVLTPRESGQVPGDLWSLLYSFPCLW